VALSTCFVVDVVAALVVDVVDVVLCVVEVEVVLREEEKREEEEEEEEEVVGAGAAAWTTLWVPRPWWTSCVDVVVEACAAVVVAFSGIPQALATYAFMSKPVACITDPQGSMPIIMPGIPNRAPQMATQFVALALYFSTQAGPASPLGMRPMINARERMDAIEKSVR